MADRAPQPSFPTTFSIISFGKTTEDEQITGITKLRCGYIYNNNPDYYLKNPYVFVVSDTTSPNDYVEVGWGTAA